MGGKSGVVHVECGCITVFVEDKLKGEAKSCEMPIEVKHTTVQSSTVYVSC